MCHLWAADQVSCCCRVLWELPVKMPDCQHCYGVPFGCLWMCLIAYRLMLELLTLHYENVYEICILFVHEGVTTINSPKGYFLSRADDDLFLRESQGMHDWIWLA